MEHLSTLNRLEELNIQGDFIIFKHSPRCSISNMAIDRFQRRAEFLPPDTPAFLVDVLSSREMSQAIAAKYNIQHESPQVLFIRNGVCIYHASHSQIDPRELSEAVKAN